MPAGYTNSLYQGEKTFYVLFDTVLHSFMKVGNAMVQVLADPTINNQSRSLVYNNFIYTLGGSAQNVLHRYNHLTNTYTALTPPSTQLSNAGFDQANGLLYQLGGGDATTGNGQTIVSEYDPVADSWTSKGAKPNAFQLAATISVNNIIYYFGGSDDGGVSHADSYAYDPIPDTWTAITNMPANLYNSAICNIGQFIFLIGGHDSVNGSSNKVYKYNIITNAYTTMANFPASIDSAGAAVLERIYVCGGETNGTLNKVVRYYNEVSDVWVTAPFTLTNNFSITNSGFVTTNFYTTNLGAG